MSQLIFLYFYSTPDSVKELPSSEPVAKKPRFQPPSVSAAPRQKFQSPCTVRTEQENVNSNIGNNFYNNSVTFVEKSFRPKINFLILNSQLKHML